MIMRILYSFLISITFLVSQPAIADACSAKARDIAGKEPNAVLLSVSTGTGANGAAVCVIKLKIKSSNGQPERIVTRTVKK